MKLHLSLGLPALLLALAGTVLLAQRSPQEPAQALAPLSPPQAARCTPFSGGSCGACTTCNYCAWCNAHPDNHCTTCLSSRNLGKKKTAAKPLATPPPPPTFPATQAPKLAQAL